MTSRRPPCRLRIIGGAWRSRILRFPPVEGLRPTPDRVRETLFNWLRDALPGARCLDLFAGSGALGFEALSRGAAEVVMVEKDPQATEQLKQNITLLDAQGAKVIQADALQYLLGQARPFDLVFLDPPFRHNLLKPCSELLEERGWLAPKAWIYLEASAAKEPPTVPPDWHILRSKQAGEVGYHLALRDMENEKTRDHGGLPRDL